MKCNFFLFSNKVLARSAVWTVWLDLRNKMAKLDPMNPLKLLWAKITHHDSNKASDLDERVVFITALAAYISGKPIYPIYRNKEEGLIRWTSQGEWAFLETRADGFSPYHQRLRLLQLEEYVIKVLPELFNSSNSL